MPSRRRPKQLLFDRGGRNFSARDRAVLDLLNPHLVRLYRESEARRSLREALALHESSRAAVVLLDANDRVTFASTAACELFVRYFGERGARLPDSLAPWLRERRRTTAGAPLRIDARGRSLVVELVDGALLLEEWQRLGSHGASERSWSSSPTAGPMRRSRSASGYPPEPCGSHLDNVYTQLGVHRRTAAAAAFVRGRPLQSRDR